MGQNYQCNLHVFIQANEQNMMKLRTKSTTVETKKKNGMMHLQIWYVECAYSYLLPVL
jgi:hypothetical protein